MKKILGALTILVLGIILFPAVTKAAASFDVTCSKLTANPNEIVNCTLKGVSIGSGETLTSVAANITVNNQMDFIGVANANTNWSDQSNGTALKFAYTGSGSLTAPFDIASFNIKMKATADDCGEICWTNLVYNGTESAGNGNCLQIDLTGVSTPSGSDNSSTIVDNPQTGSFIPYAIISGAALLAIGAILVASKKNKFYNV